MLMMDFFAMIFRDINTQTHERKKKEMKCDQKFILKLNRLHQTSAKYWTKHEYFNANAIEFFSTLLLAFFNSNVKVQSIIWHATLRTFVLKNTFTTAACYMHTNWHSEYSILCLVEREKLVPTVWCEWFTHVCCVYTSKTSKSAYVRCIQTKQLTFIM